MHRLSTIRTEYGRLNTNPLFYGNQSRAGVNVYVLCLTKLYSYIILLINTATPNRFISLRTQRARPFWITRHLLLGASIIADFFLKNKKRTPLCYLEKEATISCNCKQYVTLDLAVSRCLARLVTGYCMCYATCPLLSHSIHIICTSLNSRLFNLQLLFFTLNLFNSCMSLCVFQSILIFYV